MARIFAGTVEEYPQKFLECRSFGHQWRFTTDLNIVRLPGGRVKFARQMRCENCTSAREAAFGRDMRRTGKARYDRPDGYQTRGTNRLDVVASRMELVRRATES